MGASQLIGERSACELATFALDYALDIQKEDENMAILGIDAQNAYNSFDRQRQYDLIVEKMENMAFYYDGP